ncbi:MAG: hypothetical protein ABI333_08450 [bacterium]
MEAVHWTLPDGSVVSVRVHTAVNVTKDPALADRLVTGNLNWVQPGGSDELQPVSVPVLYHDEEARLFVLILPEAFRGRELAERAALLRALSEDKSHPVPRYVLNFSVVYGDDGLALLLDRSAGGFQGPPLDDFELAEREEAIVSREAKLAEWEERLLAQQQELELDLKQREILDRGGTDRVQGEIRHRELELTRREKELREVEQHLVEQRVEVERLEELLVHRERELDRQEKRGVASAPETDTTDSPTRVADRASMEAAARQSAGIAGADTSGLILDSPPRRGLRARMGADLGPVEGEEGDVLPADDDSVGEPGDAEPEETDLSEMSDELLDAEGDASRVPSRRRRRHRDTATTSLAEAVLAVAEEEDDRGPEHASAPEADSEAEHGERARPELPPELSHWLEEEAPGPVTYHRDGVLHVAAVLLSEDAELFVGVDPAALFQLHLLPGYPLIALGLVAEAGVHSEQEAPPAVFWTLDVLEEADQQLMDHLMEDFRFVLQLYDDTLTEVLTAEVHFPLEENVKIVRERALLVVQELSETPDPEAARRAFEDPDYQWLPETELPFAPDDFAELEKAVDVARALPLIAEWSAPEREDELILRRSFPASSWRRMRLGVLRKAIEFGLWMDKDLRRLALESGYATSRKDLLRGCLAGFERVCLGELPGGLSPVAEHENWSALLEEAERLGVPVDPTWEQLSEAASKRREFAESEEEEQDAVSEPAAGEPEDEPSDGGGEEAQEVDDEDVEEVGEDDMILEEGAGGTAGGEEGRIRGEPELADPDRGDSAVDVTEMSPAELVLMLNHESMRLDAGLELTRRGELKAVPELFITLEQMSRREVIRLFPHLVGLGEDVEQSLLESLRSGSTLIRQGSALALGALRCERAVDALLDLLLDEPTEIWREVAQALGDLGGSALMSLAARVRHADAEQRERLAVAVAAILLEGAHREKVVDLTASRDEGAAQVARRALEIESERRLEEDEADGELPSRELTTLFFSRRFFDALANDERELGEDDILDEEDIVDERDVMTEEPLPADAVDPAVEPEP